ncbi:hypothetical protein CMO85_05615 [Candidatus Woesearchaeota archaeon]|nr:hypothetical protein [Candidatus Woesearchaeota archaeon]
MFSRRYLAFNKHVVFWLASILICWLYLEPLLVLVALPFILIDLWLALCLCLMFRMPVMREDKNPPDGWSSETLVVDSYPVRWLSKTIDIEKPLAILIHGWNSTAANMIGRSKLYEDSGYNVLLFEMRAHGGNQSVDHWAAMHICHDLETALSMFNQRGWLANGFIIHGHSLGGFVAQRVLRPGIKTSMYGQGLILESPVTSYEYINNQSCEYLRIPKFLHKLMIRRLLNYYNELNSTKYSIQSVEELSTPNWGFPSCPTLLVQAKIDSTLGEKHAQLLIDVHQSNESIFEYHIVDGLKHANEANNTVRDQLIREWMDNNSLFFA